MRYTSPQLSVMMRSPWPRKFRGPIGCLLPVGKKVDSGRVNEPLGNERARHPWHGILASSENIEHDRVVRESLVRLSELPSHRLRAAVQVRLMHRDDPSRAHDAASGLESGLDLGRVMRVIVVDAHAANDAVKFEPTLGAAKRGDCVERRLRIEPEPDENRESSGRVEGVVATGDSLGERSNPLPRYSSENSTPAPVATEWRLTSARGIHSKSHNVVVSECFRDAHRAGIVARDDDGFACLVRELDERGIERIVRSVVVEVVGIDIRDECDGRVVEQKRAVGLVGLDDEKVVASERRTQSERLDDAAVDETWVGPEREQRSDDHAGRRRLAVRAGDCDEALGTDEPREGLRSVQHRDAPLDRREILGVVGPQRSREDERIGVCEPRICRVVADRYSRAKLAKVARVVVLRPVGARHGVSSREEQSRDAAHAGPADSHEVNRPEVVGQRQGQVWLDHRE